ncbi:hypothetical protein EC988_001333 [Linderina pennispora]|nr:hypothetical protein EC988_001333 [Linderina pennispora]
MSHSIQRLRPIVSTHCRRQFTVSSAWQGTERFKADLNQSNLLPGQFLVGPPHAISNIRPIKFYVPADETPQEQAYRELREDACRRDHLFWLDNNTQFEAGKAAFEQETVRQTGACTLDDLSVYYKQYQEEAYERHLAYNRYVWRRNLAMVVPGIRAWWQSVRRRERRETDGLARHAEQGYFENDKPVGRKAEREKQGVDRREEKIKSYY